MCHLSDYFLAGSPTITLPMSDPMCESVGMSKKSQKKSEKSPVTEIAFILDQSGSMESNRAAAIDGFNEFLRAQQDTVGQARLTLVLFEDQVEVPVDNIPIEEVVCLSPETYRPRGCTALLDAIGTTIKRIRKRTKALPKDQQPGKVIVAIFTDGLENVSTKYSWADISEMIRKRQDKNGWEFLFLGANQDAIATASQINIKRQNAATWEQSDRGTRSSSRAFARKVSSLREVECGFNKSPDFDKPIFHLLQEEERKEK